MSVRFSMYAEEGDSGNKGNNPQCLFASVADPVAPYRYKVRGTWHDKCLSDSEVYIGPGFRRGTFAKRNHEMHAL